ncbi:hypothetical protein QQF64_035239 [Cirrhinus molitorella]|uniref:Uncharacterized protein n=1 Tax=Cirrhinus molitorella TaxID=172907 RepID=A0ABR3NFV3_9TELE
MYPNGPLKPAALPSFLACSILGHNSRPESLSSFVKSSAKRMPASLHIEDVLVLLHISSRTILRAKRMITSLGRLASFLPTQCTTSTASDILAANSGVIFPSS